MKIFLPYTLPHFPTFSSPAALTEKWFHDIIKYNNHLCENFLPRDLYPYIYKDREFTMTRQINGGFQNVEEIQEFP
jgi:hypothetical protein